ncbi:acyl carrier protein [Enterobacteriaceae bacterium BIT-l23]|uniref:Acyl carrier protein n=1 Tax=Jejubacter calystegiae TaxID=2579935 RepID=A0A4P8YP74_9ENTR|nr:acyl carrier protein [Jejubacter calystegiae]NUU65376.1 acyl carrier protein [Enterobacteriaceae bacterium BIT-l23]QCT22715.1 acyl carrier protein [Jejubacter calystegiae]
MTTRDEIWQQVCELLDELFEVPAEKVKPETRLYEDLDLDSIDAVDMVVHLQKRTGKKISPDDFKTVRTVEDVVNAVEKLVREG